MANYELYTDGSMKSDGHDFTQGKGGWAYILLKDGVLAEIKSGSANVKTTNQRMELTAAINGLEKLESALLSGDTVTIYSDSAYLINCYNQKWYINWQRNGWCNSKKEPVANQELWLRLIPFFKTPAIYTFTKVKGHADNYYNNMCDKAAQSAADTYEEEEV